MFPLAYNSNMMWNTESPLPNLKSTIRSPHSCFTSSKRLVRIWRRNFIQKGLGISLLSLAYFVVWNRIPDSNSNNIFSDCPGMANLNMYVLSFRSYTFAIRCPSNKLLMSRTSHLASAVLNRIFAFAMTKKRVIALLFLILVIECLRTKDARGLTCCFRIVLMSEALQSCLLGSLFLGPERQAFRKASKCL